MKVIVDKEELINFIKTIIDTTRCFNNNDSYDRLKRSIDYLPLTNYKEKNETNITKRDTSNSR